MIRLAMAAAVFTAAATGSGLTASDPLQDLRWQKRLLIVFAEQDGAALKEQTEFLLVDPDCLRERDLLVFAVVDDELRTIHGTLPTTLKAENLRRELGVDRGAPFVAVLIGKDGGVKLRAERTISRTELFAIIDAMPMRRAGDSIASPGTSQMLHRR